MGQGKKTGRKPESFPKFLFPVSLFFIISIFLDCSMYVVGHRVIDITSVRVEEGLMCPI